MNGGRMTSGAPLVADATEEKFAADLDAVLAGGAVHPPIPALPASALSTAILSADGALVWRQDRFADLVPESNHFHTPIELGAKDVTIQHERRADGRAVCLVVAKPEITRRWPITVANDILDRTAGARVVVAVALADQSEALSAACRAFDLTPLETRVAIALVQAGALPDAARRCGISYQSAREAIKGARKKAGVTRQPALVARLTAVAGQLGEDDHEADRVLVDTFGLTPREAALALALMRTGSRDEAARAAGVGHAVAKKQYAAVFEALGARSASDVSRIVLEAIAAALLVGAANEELPQPAHVREPLRLMPRADGGMIAISDYGPQNGRPLLITHSGSATRLVPRSLVERLRQASWRPIAIDRPGFGMSSVRADTDDPWLAASEDMLVALDALNIERIDILVRGGVYAVATLARLHGHRVGRVVALNPDVNTKQSHKRSGAIGLLWRTGERNPHGYSAIIRWLATHTTPQRLASLQRVLLRRSPADLAALEPPHEMEDLRRSVGLFAAGRLEGTIREHYEHSQGVECAPLADGSNWRIIMGAHDPMHATADMESFWRAKLPGARFTTIADGGRLLHLTHPETLLSALAGAAR